MLNFIPNEMKERLAGTAIRSVTQPLLILSIAVTLPALALTPFIQGAALNLDLFVAGLFPVLYAFTHIYFVFVDPNRLQSEDYRLHERRLKILESSRGAVNDPALLAISSDPTPPALPSSKDANPGKLPDGISLGNESSS